MLRDEGLVLVNASIRVVHTDDGMLSYAPTDRFAVVLYVNQKTTPEGDEKMADATRRLIDHAIDRGGTFYLPYQLRYDRQQLQRAYPDIETFFALKRQYDPDEPLQQPPVRTLCGIPIESAHARAGSTAR